MARLVVLASLLAALFLAPPAGAADLPTTRHALAVAMRAAGSGSGAAVTDLVSGAELFAVRGGIARVPASVEKLYTSTTALLTFGPEGHLSTSVMASAPPAPGGLLVGDLVLRGGGDPTFGAATANAAAAQLAAAGLREVSGDVLGDESAWDTLRGPPSSGFRLTSNLGAELGALIYERGRTGLRRPYYQASPARFAAQAFARALKRKGVQVDGVGRAGIAPPGAVTLLDANSPTIADLVGRMNRPSDNYLAESLIKGLGAEFGGRGTTAAGAAIVRSTVARFRIAPQVVDGSGLSRADRTTPRQVVRLLAGMRRDPAGGAFAASLPVAGLSGTLVKRMRGTAAQGRCRAKTGTLPGISSLAGYCDNAAGRHVAFAFLMNRVSVSGARRLQDRMTVVLARLSR